MQVTVIRVVCVVVLSLLSIGLFTLGALAPKIVQKIALAQTPVTNGSDSASMYRKLPVDITQKIYVFNITNKAEFMKGATPVLEQLGPYVFISVWVKNMSWNGDKLIYNETRNFVFSPELSNGTLFDEVEHVDLVYLSAVRIIEDLMPPLNKVAERLLKLFSSKSVLARHTVGQILYDGYKDELAEVASIFSKKLPVIDGKVGFLLGMNATADGEFSVYSGANDTLDKLNEITSYKDSPTLPYYGPACNSIYGTNGELYAPFTDKPRDQISVFNKLFCRPWTLYLNSTSWYNGIENANYASGDDMFTATGNAAVDACYEKRPTNMKGTFDASTCQFDQDIVLSFPHFLKGDSRLFDTVEGMNPDITKHDFGISASNFGLVTDMKIRVQINSFLSSDPMDKNKPKFVYPMFWQELVLQEEDRTAFMDLIWKKAVQPKVILQAVSFGLGSVLLAAAVSLVIVWLISDFKKTPPVHDRGPLVGEDEVDEEPEQIYHHV